jgi:hypothetical protein
MLLIFTMFIAETCRDVVGDGSLPAQSWNRPLIAVFRSIRPPSIEAHTTNCEKTAKKGPSRLAGILIILSKESFLLLLGGGLIHAGYYIVLISLPQQLTLTYHYNSIQFGLCCIPMEIGQMFVRLINREDHGRQLSPACTKIGCGSRRKQATRHRWLSHRVGLTAIFACTCRSIQRCDHPLCVGRTYSFRRYQPFWPC